MDANAFNVLLKDLRAYSDEDKKDGSSSSEGFIKKVDADILFVSNSAKKRLTRIQFFDMMIALASAKSPKTHSASECLTTLMESHVLKFLTFTETGIDAFREEKLYNLPVDKLFKARREELVKIYKDFSGAEQAPGERKVTSINEYVD